VTDARRASRRRATWTGLVAGAGLLTLYVGVLTVVSGWPYARGQIPLDAPYLVFLVPMFGAQVGLWAYLRMLARIHMGAMAGASGGVTSTAMIACCAHFLPTILPYAGVSIFATALAAWRGPLLLVAIGSNAIGLTLSLRALKRVPKHSPTTTGVT